MPKRISRKLLVGLGSIVTFGAVGTVSGFGIKSIIDSSLNSSKLNQLSVNTSQTGSLTNIPNYHVATKDMFIPTKNLKRFHFGNTQIGQKITPWGWLGVFDDDGGVKSRIALTGWNGEIIWVNETYKSLEKFNVYDMQYDFNSNLIFVLRTNSTNGFYNGHDQYPEVLLEVLNAKTGEKYKDSVDDGQFDDFQRKAKQKLINDSVLLKDYDTDDKIKAKTKNLYYLDLTYSDKKKAILATWMPNYMQMARQTYGGTQEGSLPSFFDVVKTWEGAATSFVFQTEKLKNQEVYGKKQRKFKLSKSSGIREVTDDQGKLIQVKIKEGPFSNSLEVDGDSIFLLANPFFTTSHNGEAFVMHLIGATVAGKVYHKTIGWTIDTSDQPDIEGEIYRLTVGAENLTDQKRYDNIEILNNGNGYFNLKPDKSWTKAKGWNPEFINANLRVNKNMFDENSIVFAYPYSSSSDEASDSINGSYYGQAGVAMPVFNVAQIWLNKKNAQFKKDQQTSKKFHINYDFGKQIDDYYSTNGPNYGNNNSLNSIYPYPSPSSFEENNVNHSYNRLISVSPFDNTVIYAAKPNIGEEIFSVHNRDNKDKWAGFWIANSWAWDKNIKKKYYHPLVISNDSSIISNFDQYNSEGMNYMLKNINDLYSDGFTFDIRSRMDSNRGATTSLNLYFNQTGNGVNESYNSNEGFQSSKIGLLRDILYDAGSNNSGQPGSKGWADNITPKFRDPWNNEAKKLFVTTINKDSFSSIIHSRANLKKWYPRTWSNANYPSNMLRAEEIFRIGGDDVFDVAIATQFDQKLTGTAFNGGNKSIDLVTAWLDKTENNTSSNYRKRFNRLIMKRPKIEAGLTAEEDGLGLVTKYELPTELFNLIVGKKDWEIKTNQSHLTLTKVDTVENTSKEILSAWGNAYKMKKIAPNTAAIDGSSTAWNEEIEVTEVLDKKDFPTNPNKISFGNGNNNNITRNDVQALRLMLKIVKPRGNDLPRWFSGLPEYFFNRFYPLEPAYQGETTFKEVVKAFANKKAELIDLSEANNAAVSFANLKIEASLELNPKFASYTAKTDKIYSVPNGGKAIVDKSNAHQNQLIIYKDQFSGNRTIYDQSAISYADFGNGGFANSMGSWSADHELGTTKNIKVTTDYGLLPDNLVRKSSNDTGSIFSFDYKEGTSDKLEIRPNEQSWFLNHFKNYNRMIGLFVQFEYQTATKNTWTLLGNPLSDADIQAKFQDGKLTIDAPVSNIKKLRFKLVQDPNTNSEFPVDFQNFTPTDNKYVSNEHAISSQRYIIKNNQIQTHLFANPNRETNKYLNNIQKQDIENYVRKVVNESISDQDIKDKVTLKFEYDGVNDLTFDKLWEKLQAKITGTTPFAISPDGSSNKGEVIKAYFSAINSTDGIVFINESGAVVNDQSTKENVKSDLVTKIDVGAYIKQITTSGLTVNPPATVPGTFNTDGNDIQFPKNNANSGFLSQMDFNKMKSALSNVGVTIRFKGYNPATNTFGDWQNDLSLIKNYNTTKPEIKIGFQVDSANWKVKMFNVNSEINENEEIAIKLNLPKLITISKNVVDSFKVDHGISGNTKKLIYDLTKINKLINDIKNDPLNKPIQGIEQAPLEVVFRLGNTKKEFSTIEQLESFLASQNSDVESNKIEFKIQITKGNENNWILNDNQPYTLLDKGNDKVPIFVHDADIWEDINIGTTISGKNTNLTWNFPTNDGFTIQDDDTFADSSSKGKGLKLEFTKDINLDVTQDGWTKRITNVDLGTKAIYVRIIAKDNSYIYQKTAESQNKKIQINLDKIREQINVESIWLKQNLVTNETDINQAITMPNLQKYEDSVMGSIKTLDQETKNKLIIKYSITNDQNNNANNFVDKNQLVQSVKNYKNSSTFDILQLWNGHAGVKIITKFFKADQSGLYDLVYKKDDPEEQQLETEKITTTIEFQNVIKWLTETAKLVKVLAQGNDYIFQIPDLSLSNDPKFNNKRWEEIVNFFKEFGISIQYREVLSSIPDPDQGWKDNLTELKKYDPNIGKIQIRFKFDREKSKNIKLKTSDSRTYDGRVDEKTGAFSLSLDIKLILNIKEEIVKNNFIDKEDVISGNTKYLLINQTYEKEMIKKLIQDNVTNNPEFSKANLIVKYKLDQSQDDWKTREEFINLLKSSSTDQTSNKVLFKFDVTNSDNFSVDNSQRVLFNPEQINPADWKVKIFINDGTWEEDVKTVTVTGRTSGLIWNWNNLKSKVTDDTVTNKVGNNQLQVEFSAKTGANYDDPEATDTTNLTAGWTTLKPSVLDPNIKDLYIRIKAKPGYVYGPGYDQNSHPKTAKAHKVDLQIKREILVDPNQLSTTLKLEAGAKFLNEITDQTFKGFVKEGLDQIKQQEFRNKVTIKFNFKDGKGLTSEELNNKIKSIINSNNDPEYGVLQLWNGNSGEKISAYYTLADPNDQEYELITGNVNIQPNESKEIITSQVRTKIDLREIVTDLKSKKIEVISTNKNHNFRNLIMINSWKMPVTKTGSTSLRGLNWEVFEKRLNDVGVLVEVKMVTNSNNSNDWKSLNDLKTYDDTTLKLALRFKINQQGDNIVLSVLGDEDVDSATTEANLVQFEMNINAPAMVVVKPEYLNEFKNGYKISGNTKNINLDKESEDQLINKIVKENITTNPDVFKDLESRLTIEYYLGKEITSVTDEQWKNQVDFISSLEETNIDQKTNQIWFRLNVKEPTDQDGQIFQINKTANILNQEDITDKAKVKIFINERGFTDAIDTLKAVGSTDSFNITGLESWIQSIPTGLKVWWSKETNPSNDDDSGWEQTQPTTLNPDKKLWVRFKVDPGYQFQNAREDKPEYSDKKEINTQGITVIIKLQKEWLEKIIMTGDFNVPNIDENKVITEIKNAGILPNNKPNLIHLEYQIKGTKNWLDKDKFITQIKALKGAKDDKNFILKREELEVRFAIAENEDQYGLEIDNQVVTDDNRDDFNVQIIDDKSKRNDSFIGIINIDLLKDFVKKNFKVEGSTSKPELIINNKSVMDTLFMPYQSDDLFDILYSTNYDKNTSTWTWDPSKSILKNGQFINPSDLWNELHATIGPDKKFAIKFISKKENKYKVYQNNQEQTGGYVLDISENVKITIEINNPFTDDGKILGIWTRDDSKQAKYYQGKGGFKIVVANKNNLEVDSNATIESAQEFLANSKLAENEKNALEFVFHNFGSSAEVDEIKRVAAAITNYDDQTWQSFDSIKEKANDNWSKEIGLKVGDYLAVAIRVKKQYALQDEPFVLKDNDYSMILPVMEDSNNQIKTPGRISGYKIKTEAIKLQKNSVTLSNTLSAELPPLDGWTELQQLNLAKDDLGNYLGVDLKLQLYSDFYKDAKGEVLVSGSWAKLIKRKTGDGIIEAGPYTDGAGKPIKDPTTGQEIKIYKDQKTGRLSAPVKNNSPQRTKKLDHLGDGVFRLPRATTTQEQSLFSLFRNQDVDLKVEASVGKGTDDLPDFYLDNNQEKLLNLKSEISDQIKFLVENEQKISYAWNYEDFVSDKIEYKHPSNLPNKKPEDGFAKINTKFELIKKQAGKDSETITGSTIEEAVENIKNQLNSDFNNQLKFQISYFNSKGGKQDIDGNNIYQFSELKNKDRIVLKIVAVADDLFYINEQQPLIINVNGLTQAAPNADKLQHLRVKQGGVIDGQGSFKVLVSDPDNLNEDERQILKGWKFMIRVWDKSEEIDPKTNQRKIKIDWTDDQARIKNLANGDRVEWKLVSEEGNPVKEAYYNTIALEHKSNDDGTINYKFAQVNYPAGEGTYDVVKEGVGDYPDDETKYPEDSGFVISGLKSAVDIFQISKENFAKVMQQLNPTYVGINKQGTIKMEPKYFEDKYWVNSEGELFTKDQQATLQAQDQEQTKKEILLTEFLDNVTFYTHDPVLANYQGGFKFSGNDVNNNNHLTNGDKVWATFDMLNESDENIIINGNEIISSVTLQLSDVSGLKEVIDPMSPLWYVLMALAGVVTLGTAALIAFLMTRHKKLKGK